MADDRRRRAVDRFWAELNIRPEDAADQDGEKVKAALFSALDIMEERGEGDPARAEPMARAQSPGRGIRVDVLTSPDGFVLVQLGYPPLLVTSLGMEPDYALQVAQLLIKHAMAVKRAMGRPI